MNPQANPPARRLPFGVVVAASLVIVFHFFAVGTLVLAARSGPWSVPYLPLPTNGEPPHFAGVISDTTSRLYLQPLGLADDLHFESNRTTIPAVRFEAHIFDDKGDEKIIEFPNPKANGSVRYRQMLLAQNLGGDYSLPPRPPGESIPADPKKAKMVSFFQPVGGPNSTALELCESYEFMQPKVMLMAPSEWSLIMTRAYARYLQREHHAAKVEIVRLYRNPVSPMLILATEPGKLLLDNLPPQLEDLRLETRSAKLWDGQFKKSYP